MYFSTFEEWWLIEKKAMEFVKGKVLDIGCGAGRHSIYLQEKGFDVTGIDISPLAVKVCRLRGLKKTEVYSCHKSHKRNNSQHERSKRSGKRRSKLKSPAAGTSKTRCTISIRSWYYRSKNQPTY